MNTSHNNNALSDQAKELLNNHSFCIVGCGGVGANFAEVLVRSGAKNITLIDADNVSASNLNRVMAFCLDDVAKNSDEIENKKKVFALKDRLEKINNAIKIDALPYRLGPYDSMNQNNQKLRAKILESHIVIIAMDHWQSRFELFDLLKDTDIKSISIGINFELSPKNIARYDVTWLPYIREEERNNKKYIDDYGKDNVSRASIVLEAVVAAFELMMFNLLHPNNKEPKQVIKHYENHLSIPMKNKPSCWMEGVLKNIHRIFFLRE